MQLFTQNFLLMFEAGNFVSQFFALSENVENGCHILSLYGKSLTANAWCVKMVVSELGRKEVVLLTKLLIMPVPNIAADAQGLAEPKQQK